MKVVRTLVRFGLGELKIQEKRKTWGHISIKDITTNKCTFCLLRKNLERELKDNSTLFCNNGGRIKNTDNCMYCMYGGIIYRHTRCHIISGGSRISRWGAPTIRAPTSDASAFWRKHMRNRKNWIPLWGGRPPGSANDIMTQVETPIKCFLA